MMELNLAAYLVHHPAKFEVCRQHLGSIRFESAPLQTLWGCLERAYSSYKAFPSIEELGWALTQECPQDASDLTALANTVYTMETGGITGEYLTSVLLESERAKILEAVGNSASIRDLERIAAHLTKLRNCLEQEERTWIYPFSDSLITTPYQVLREIWGDPLPLGIPEWDSRWLQGGPRRGELLTLIGLTGGGKSILLLWWALYQAQQGHFVAYFSFDNVVGELLSRIWCASSGVLMDQVNDTPETLFASRLLIYAKETFPGIENRLLVQKWPRGTRTVEDIRRVMDQMEDAHDRDLDAVYVDYGDCVKAMDTRKDTRFQLDETFSALGAIAEEYNILMVTATQANRAAKYLEFLDIDSAAEAWQKAWHSAIVLGLCQSRLEKQQGRAKLVVGKARRIYSDYIVPILMNPNNMRVLPDPEHPIQFRSDFENNNAIDTAAAPKRVRGKNSGAMPDTTAALPAPSPPLVDWDAMNRQSLMDGLGMVQAANNTPAEFGAPPVVPQKEWKWKTQPGILPS